MRRVRLSKQQQHWATVIGILIVAVAILGYQLFAHYKIVHGRGLTLEDRTYGDLGRSIYAYSGYSEPPLTLTPRSDRDVMGLWQWYAPSLVLRATGWGRAGAMGVVLNEVGTPTESIIGQTVFDRMPPTLMKDIHQNDPMNVYPQHPNLDAFRDKPVREAELARARTTGCFRAWYTGDLEHASESETYHLYDWNAMYGPEHANPARPCLVVIEVDKLVAGFFVVWLTE